MDAKQWLDHMKDRKALIAQKLHQAEQAQREAHEAALSKAIEHSQEAFQIMLNAIYLNAVECDPELQTAKVPANRLVGDAQGFPSIDSLSYVVTVGQWRISANTAIRKFDDISFEVNTFSAGAKSFSGTRKYAAFTLYFRRLDNDMPEIPQSFPEQVAPPAYDSADLTFSVDISIPVDVDSDNNVHDPIVASDETMDDIAEQMAGVEQMLIDWQADLAQWKATYRE